MHGNHVHPFQDMTGKTGSFTTSTDHDADSFYRVTLTATDADGLTDSKTVVLRPETVNLSIASSPAGAPINYAGYSLVAAPHKAQAAIGFRTSVSTAQRFVANGRTWEFASWSDGGTIAHDVTIPTKDLALVANYRDVGPATPAPVGGFGPSPGPGPSAATDKSGPSIALTGAKARRLAGTVSDPSGVAEVKVGVRTRKHRGGCRWWSAKSGRLARKMTDCTKPRLIKAELKQLAAGTWSWSLALNGKLGKGRYTLAFRATDAKGNVTTTLAAGSRSLRIGK